MKLRKEKEPPEIPTASMADIAFLLIVFFMLTSVFAETRGINFSVPQKTDEEDDAQEADEDAVHIKIGGDGTVLFDGKPWEGRENVATSVVKYLSPKLERYPEKPILLTAEKSAPYGIFVQVYDGLRNMEEKLKTDGKLPRQNSLKLSILSLKEIEDLKARFGADIFG